MRSMSLRGVVVNSAKVSMFVCAWSTSGKAGFCRFHGVLVPPILILEIPRNFER